MPSCYGRTNHTNHHLQYTFKENDLLYQINGYTNSVQSCAMVPFSTVGIGVTVDISVEGRECRVVIP